MSQFHRHLKVGYRDRLRLWRHRRAGAALGDGCVVGRGSELLRFPANIAIGAGAVVKKNVQLCACNAAARIEIGAGTTVGDYSYVYASERIVIGARALIAPFCYLVDGNHGTARDRAIRDQPLETAPIGIGDGAWLGARVTVLPGMTVGEGAVVAAGSVVTKPVPPYEIWGGVPARKIGERT